MPQTLRRLCSFVERGSTDARARLFRTLYLVKPFSTFAPGPVQKLCLVVTNDRCFPHGFGCRCCRADDISRLSESVLTSMDADADAHRLSVFKTAENLPHDGEGKEASATFMGSAKKVDPRLCELAPRGQGESGRENHAPFTLSMLYKGRS